MIYDKEIEFSDLTVYIENEFLKQKTFSKPTDNHEYSDVRSMRTKKQCLDPFRK